MTIELITLAGVTPTGRPSRRSVRLSVMTESDAWLRGNEVDREGVSVNRHHIIDKKAVAKRVRLRMNRQYGELEPEA